MKAAIRSQYGGPEVLSVREVEKPVPKANEILVKVRATTVNRTDCGVLTGKPFIFRFFIGGLIKPKALITGTDFAGDVEAVGANVSAFKAGDKVWGFNDNGLPSHAEYLALSAEQAILPVPEGISYEQAAASAEAAHYAYNFLNKVPLNPGQRALVNGGTGAIGSAAIQFLKFRGIHVTAVCGTERLAVVQSLGADQVVDYQRTDFTQTEARYDFVFDAVGKSTFFKCQRLLKEGGVYLSSELGPYAQNLFLPLAAPFMKRKVIFPIPSNIKESMAFTSGLLEGGQFRPLIDRRYPIEDIRAAFEYVASGQKIGNVILSPTKSEFN